MAAARQGTSSAVSVSARLPSVIGKLSINRNRIRESIPFGCLLSHSPKQGKEGI